MSSNRLFPGIALCAVASLALVGCGSGGSSSESSASAAASTVTIQDDKGEQTVDSPPSSVVATDNRVFETLSDWGVQLKAAPKTLIPETIAYKDDDSIVDLGSHREPDLEAIAGVDPDLVINGQRFSQHYDDIKKLVPDAAMLDLDPRDDQPSTPSSSARSPHWVRSSRRPTTPRSSTTTSTRLSSEPRTPTRTSPPWA